MTGNKAVSHYLSSFLEKAKKAVSSRERLFPQSMPSFKSPARLLSGHTFSLTALRQFCCQATISRRIITAIVSVIACYAAISAYAYYQLAKIDDNYRDLLTKSVKLETAAKTAAWYLSQSASTTRGYLLTKDEHLLTLYPVYSAKVDSSVDEMLKLATDPTAKEYAQKIEDSKNAYSATVYAMQRFQREKNAIAFTSEFQKGNQAIDNAIAAAEAIVSLEEQEALLKRLENSERTRQIKMQLLLVNLVALLLGVSLSIVISRRIARPIKAIADTTRQIADGDLRMQALPINSKDEVGDLSRSTNQMLAGLKAIVQNIDQSAGNVASASEQLSSSATEVSETAAHVTTTVCKVAKSAEEQLLVVQAAISATDAITSGVENINHAAHTAAELSRLTTSNAEHGQAVVDHAVSYLHTVSQKVEQTTEKTISLGEASKQVSQIISMITNIAGQTNLLALNAAIEAARAGEAGRGFAVVADEVRKLAEQSREAAQTIGRIIHNVEQQITLISGEMTTRNQELSQGVTRAAEAGQSFREITTQIADLSEAIQTIRETTTQVNQNGHTVRTAMADMETIARINASGATEISAASEEQTASVEEMAASTHALTNLAGDLRRLVLQFKY